MDPIATLFLALIIILVVASILIPQIQERRRR
jgi:type II secretory pathway component PulF